MPRNGFRIGCYLVVLLASGPLGGPALMRAHAEMQQTGSKFPEPSAVIVASIEHVDPQLERLAVLIEEQLRNRGARLLSMFDAAAELGETYSAPAPSPHALLRELEEETERTLLAVADGDDRNTERLADRMLDKVDGYLWHIGQLPLRIGDVANICLFKVRALWHRDKIALARTQANRCLQIVPDLVAEPRLHPDEVRDYVREARLRLSGEPVPGAGHILPGAKLVVRTGPNVPPGCNIHLNGRPLGKPPALTFTVAAGTYQVHLGCGNYRSVVHKITVQPGESREVTIDADFGDHLIVRPRPGFVYPDQDFFYRQHEAFSKQMAHALHCSSMFVARGGEGDTAHIDYYTYSITRNTIQFEASVELPYNHGAVTPANVEKAIGALVQRESAKIEGSTIETGVIDEKLLEPPPVDGAQAPRQGGAWLDVAKWATLGIGVAGLGLSWVFYATAVSKQNDIANGSGGPAVVSDRDDASLLSILSAGAGGMISTASLSLLLLEDERGVPWWSWVTGIAGLGVLGTGIAIAALHDGCDSAPCDTRRSLGVPLGPMLMFHALPLIAVPITHIVRHALSLDDASDGRRAANFAAAPWLSKDSVGFGLWMNVP
ncbi:MAG: PEGA domain-containing protein [Myxococcales bacterium]|nr:PEGA domain-containing protein [Myxococcales bacterium]